MSSSYYFVCHKCKKRYSICGSSASNGWWCDIEKIGDYFEKHLKCANEKKVTILPDYMADDFIFDYDLDRF